METAPCAADASIMGSPGTVWAIILQGTHSSRGGTSPPLAAEIIFNR